MEHCVVCGNGIPEGRQVGAWCECNVTREKELEQELTKGELTRKLSELQERVLNVELTLYATIAELGSIVRAIKELKE